MDDKTKRGGQDRSRIDVTQDYELRHWAHKFGATKDQVQAAVKGRRRQSSRRREAFAAQQAKGVTKIIPETQLTNEKGTTKSRCEVCDDTGWVCAGPSDTSWYSTSWLADECNWGAPGVQCQRCNNESPPRKTGMVRIICDKHRLRQ